MNKTIATIIMGVVILAGGAMVFADGQIDPYTDKGATLEVATPASLPNAGNDKVELSKDVPKITVSKWNGEAGMGIQYIGVNTTGERSLFSDQFQWKDTKQEVHAYPIQVTPEIKDGGFEFGIYLKEKPATQNFDFMITNTSQFDFFEQKSLNEENDPSWPEAFSCTATECHDKNGNLTLQRPENVVNSIAVYYKKKNHFDGDINYGTGKFQHIYRPQMVDGNGVKNWADLSYKDFYVYGIMTVHIPDSVYNDPSINWTGSFIDPTFGKTAIGASRNNLSTNQLEVSHFTLSDNNAVMSKETCYVDYTSNTPSGIATVWDQSSSKPLNLKEKSSAVAYPLSAAWTDYTLSSTLAASGEYWLGTQASINNAGDYYDAGAANSAYFTTGGTYPNPTNPWTDFSNSRTRVLSCYITYTTASAGSSPGKVIFNGSPVIMNGSPVIIN